MGGGLALHGAIVPFCFAELSHIGGGKEADICTFNAPSPSVSRIVQCKLFKVTCCAWRQIPKWTRR